MIADSRWARMAIKDTGPWVALAFSYIHISTVLSVHISRLTSPSVVLGGDPLTIDCDFDYQEEEQDQLDLKWYFNSSPFPIYQWVPSMNKGPQVIGELFKDKLDLLYSAHNDTFKKHRALHILNPDHRFSGTYMCKVSSFVDEDFQQKDILVIAPHSQPGPQILRNLHVQGVKLCGRGLPAEGHPCNSSTFSTRTTDSQEPTCARCQALWT